MITPPSPATITRIEKAAVDNGFDLELAREGNWLGFASTQAPLRLWLGAFGDALYIAAFSQAQVARAIEHGTLAAAPLPAGAVAARTVFDVPALHRLVRRAFQLSRTLPDKLLDVFQSRVGAMPQNTEAERLVVARVGQDIFRAGLLEYWEGACAITGLAVPELLRASHIKPWADCTTDAERLDIFNGLLLAPHLDAAFDGGFITIAHDGTVVVSATLGRAARLTLGFDEALRVRALHEGHREYLPWHQERVFRNVGRGPAL